MKARAVTDFASTFGVEIALNPDLTVEKGGRFYLLNQAIKPMVRQEFFYDNIAEGCVRFYLQPEGLDGVDRPARIQDYQDHAGEVIQPQRDY